MSMRVTIGRLQVYVEPRDIWIGLYIAADAIYVCPLPLLVFRWTRRRRWLDEVIGRIRTVPPAPPAPFDLSAVPVIVSDAVPDGQIYVINHAAREALRLGQPLPPRSAARLDVEGGKP